MPPMPALTMAQSARETGERWGLVLVGCRGWEGGGGGGGGGGGKKGHTDLLQRLSLPQLLERARSERFLCDVIKLDDRLRDDVTYKHRVSTLLHPMHHLKRRGIHIKDEETYPFQ